MLFKFLSRWYLTVACVGRRAIYGAPVLFTNEASIPEEIAHREPYDLVETGSNIGETALDSKQAQMKNFRRRRDAVFFGEKPEFEQLKTASTSSRPSLTHKRTTSTTSAASTLPLTIRCFLPKGDARFLKLKFPVGRALAVTGELQGFVGEGPDRTASIIVSEIASYSHGTDSAKILNNCCGVSCTEQDPATTERLLVALDPVKVDNTRDLMRSAQMIDDSPKSKGHDIMPNSPPDGVPRRPALAKLRKASSNITIKSKFTNLFTRSGNKTEIPTPSGFHERPATSPRSASFDERSSLEHVCTGINATAAASLNRDEQSDYDLATPWSNELTKSGLRQAKLRQQLPRLQTAEAQALARQPLLPNLSQFSPLSIDSLSPNTEGLSPFEAELSPMKMMRQFDEPSSSVETRLQPSKRSLQPDRDLHIDPAAKKSAKSPTLTKRRKVFDLKLITERSTGFPKRPTANDVPVGPVGYEASNPTTISPARCASSWGISPPIPHHHCQQHPKIPFPKFIPIWNISKKKRAKKVINALNSGPPSLLKYTTSTPNLNFYPSPLSIPPPPKQQRIPKSPSASNILPHREQRVVNNVAARNSAPVQKMEMIKEEDIHEEEEKVNDAMSATSWYDSDSHSLYEEDENGGDSTESLFFWGNGGVDEIGGEKISDSLTSWHSL